MVTQTGCSMPELVDLPGSSSTTMTYYICPDEVVIDFSENRGFPCSAVTISYEASFLSRWYTELRSTSFE